jgi:ectoine hydroxylase-related dioxygenase (phytanoyl-CoA dioxygenase family)
MPTISDVSDVWLNAQDIDLAQLSALVSRQTSLAAVPLAVDIVANVPVYTGALVADAGQDEERYQALAAEWHRVLSDGAGAIVIRGAWDTELIDQVSLVFEQILAEEATAGIASGDHFAKTGANARVWNAHEKLAVRAPEAFIDYNTNETLAMASLAWLGPLYRVTAQLNLVRPGGQAQEPHRDYHMGFQPAELLARFPYQSHRLSAALTLQGAVAHVDMPLASGPTQLLPYSQLWPPGYLVKGRAEVDAVFAKHRIQIELRKGDALFFNPALLHAAGDNQTADIERLANLLQISAAWGRTMEVVDSVRIARHVYPALLERVQSNALDAKAVERVIAASVDGYAFPANLELEPPRGHLPPASQQDLLRESLRQGWTAERLDDALCAQQALKRSC